jgi:hypothetical protein
MKRAIEFQLPYGWSVFILFYLFILFYFPEHGSRQGWTMWTHSHRADQDPVCLILRPPNPDKEKTILWRKSKNLFDIFWNILFHFQNEIYFESVKFSANRCKNHQGTTYG